jgi:hypothetical protein
MERVSVLSNRFMQLAPTTCDISTLTLKFQIRRVGELPREEGAGAQDSHLADL